MTGKTRGIAIITACAALGMMGVLAYGDASGKAGDADSGGTMSKQQKIGYAIGYQIGKSFKTQNVQVDPADVAAGIRAGMGQGKPRLSQAKMKQVMVAFQREMMTRMIARQQAAAKKNAASSSAFLKANAKKPGVHVTKSGLQYKIIKRGRGQSPGLKDTVKVSYTGTLPNGKQFDSSKAHGGPASFEVDHIIPGWTEALRMMKPGSEWRLWVPAKLAYGKQGTHGIIGPNQTLVFDVQLLGVEKAKDNGKSKSKSPGGAQQH